MAAAEAETRPPPGSAWRGRRAGAAGVTRGVARGLARGLVYWGPVALWLACAGARDGRHVPVAAEHGAPPAGGTHAARPRAGAGPAVDRDGPALTEAAARALLAERFRAAGFRVRYDVPVARDGAFALTVDGYDPARRVGFEYVAEAEAGADLDPDERAALARDHEQRILIIDAAGTAETAETAETAGAADAADEIRALAERFLQALETPGPRPPR
jgi:hypothetical protein